MTLNDGVDKIKTLILEISKEDDLTSQILLEHLIDYALEARDIRQTLIAEDTPNSPLLIKTNPDKYIIH